MDHQASFYIGVNYWASHAGADMWRIWDEQQVAQDLALLHENGIEMLRVFPNWRDFQPVEPAFGGSHSLHEYRMQGDRLPENPYYLDEEMLSRFTRFCEIAQEHHLRLIVGLITGWMSGRLYLPQVLDSRNIYTDPVSLYFQQLFIKGFVERMKDQPAIYAWDLGNECNCMDKAACREEAYNWSSVIVNAIRACDPDRPIVSGMHSLQLEGVWNLQDQSALTDILTTHPYPFWVEHCLITPLDSFRTLLHATAQTEYYASIGKIPCLVEEIGSMGPMVCEEDRAAMFLKVNLWSNWAHGAPGLLWWCAHEQSHLSAPPYDWNMCERELGMTDRNAQPKPTLRMMKTFREELSELQLELPRREHDAVCILSNGQDHWGIAFTSYLLAVQAGLTLEYTYAEQELPDSPMYFLPSVTAGVMSKHRYEALKKKVYEGATLYLSLKDGILSEFEELTGFHVVRTSRSSRKGTAVWKDLALPFEQKLHLEITPAHGEAIFYDETGNVLFGCAPYGRGKVFFLNFPLEEMLIDDEEGTQKPYYCLYQTAAEEILRRHSVQKKNPSVGMTIHKGQSCDYAVLVNYSSAPQNPEFSFDPAVYASILPLRGQLDSIPPFETVITKLCRQPILRGPAEVH